MTDPGSSERPRVGVLGLWHETNTYSARVATLQDFEDYELLSGPAILAHHRGTRSVVGGFLDGLAAGSEEIIPVFTAGAWPAGPADRATYTELMRRLRAELSAAGPLDGIVLNLHGAMVAEGEPDVEAAVLQTIREVVGAVPVAAVLDLHGNPSPRLTELCDILVGYATFPHVDMWERGLEAVALLREMIAGTPLCTTLSKIPVLTTPLVQGTEDEPMRTLYHHAAAEARAAGARSISVFAGFAYSDVERAGLTVLVVDTPQRRQLADELADRIGDRIHELVDSGAFVVSRPPARDAVRAALAATETPVVLVDVADNIGGGSAGDGTVLLTELLAAGATGAVVVLADAAVAHSARAIGVGGHIEALVGGHTDSLHGPPVRVSGTVTQLSDGTYVSHGSWGTGLTFSMGTTAVLDLGGITLVVTERATPPFHSEHLTILEIEPADCRILVAKGALAWRAAYGDVARTIIEVDTPGACPIDPWQLPRSTRPVGWSAVARRPLAGSAA